MSTSSSDGSKFGLLGGILGAFVGGLVFTGIAAVVVRTVREDLLGDAGLTAQIIAAAGVVVGGLIGTVAGRRRGLGR